MSKDAQYSGLLFRTGDAERPQRSRRKLAAWIAGALLTLLILVIACVLLVRPAALLGVDSRSLADSVGAQHCTRVDSSDDWSCAVRVLRAGGSTTRIQRFNVAVDPWGCWSAIPAE